MNERPMIDLRSDTVTQPTEMMRRRMAEALVGDDVYGEDPTVNQLEAVAAERLGKEAGLFVPSGTMANQVAVLTHSDRGDEMFIHRDSHVYYYEGGAAALWSGVMINLLDGDEGLFSPEALRDAVRPENIHHPRPRLLSLENTHNRAGGAALGPDRVDPVVREARRLGLRVHVDGARLFNAAVALKVPAERLVRDVDSVSICLSKGLGAPVGSVLVGARPFIESARRYRKWLGGGMRQAGILAAAGLMALDNVDRLADDHRRAGELYRSLAEMGFRVRQPHVPTNMVMIETGMPADQLVQAARERGVVFGTMGSHLIRLVTHLDVDDTHIAQAIEVFQQLRGLYPNG